MANTIHKINISTSQKQKQKQKQKQTNRDNQYQLKQKQTNRDNQKLTTIFTATCRIFTATKIKERNIHISQQYSQQYSKQMNMYLTIWNRRKIKEQRKRDTYLLSHVKKSTRRRLAIFCLFVLLWLVRWSRHLVIYWRLLGNPGTGLIRD